MVMVVALFTYMHLHHRSMHMTCRVLQQQYLQNMPMLHTPAAAAAASAGPVGPCC
jgi:hypothetical protein